MSSLAELAAEALGPSWLRALREQLADSQQLHDLLRAEQVAGAEVYPPLGLVFNAFTRTPFEQVRVVIVGQDPYHGAGQAMGLCFSVPRGVSQPPSLRNVLRELETDLGVPRPRHGDLSAWTDRGVLLLNTSLTVRAGEAGSHAGRGWERLTDAALCALSEQRDGVAFLLWGRHAQAKAALIDERRHLLLIAAHPSPLSAAKGFFGCRHFSRVNEFLRARDERPIEWSLID